MLYVLDDGNNTKYFVSNDMSLEEFAMGLILEMRKNNSSQCIYANYGYDNIRIKAPDIKFDMWIYNSNHPVYQNAEKL